MSSQQTGSKDTLTSATLISETVALIYGSHNDAKQKKIGLEVELPFVSKSDLKPIPFSGGSGKSITAVFNALCKKGAWSADTVENGKVTSLKSESGSVTLEPGGQIEFASAARLDLAQIKKDVDGYFNDCKDISGKLGVDVVPFGFHPHVGIDDCPYISERSRFKALKPVFEAERGYSAWGQSSSVQVTLDSPSKDEAFAAFKLGLTLQPLAAAMFANSPFSGGVDSGYQSWRRHNLESIDSPLYTVPEALFEKNYGIEDWAAHVLTVPMSFIVRNDEYISVKPAAFQDMVGLPLPELAHLPEEDQYLTKNDLLDHLTGIKPEMLLKPNLLLEFRAADLGPSPAHWMAVAAFWTGIFYDKDAFKAAEDYVANWSKEERTHLGQNVAKHGLQTKVGGLTAQDIVLDLLEISKKGLSKIEPDAIPLLDILFDQAGKGVTPADHVLKTFKENGNDISSTLKQTFLFAPEKNMGLKKAG